MEIRNIKIRDVLGQLAINGFVLIEDIDNPIAKVISLYNAGGVMKKSSQTIGISRQIWAKSCLQYCIVPLQQSMRLIIASMIDN